MWFVPCPQGVLAVRSRARCIGDVLCLCTRAVQEIMMKRWQTILSVISWCLSLLGGFWLGYRILPGCHELNEAFWAFTIILLPLCFFLPLVTPCLPWLCPLLTFAAVAVGVGTDAMTDRTMDRNLWGIEAIIAQAMALPGIAIGGAMGSVLAHRIWKKKGIAQPATPPYSEPAARSPQG